MGNTKTPGLYINSFPIATDKEKQRIVQEYIFATYKSAIKTDGANIQHPEWQSTLNAKKE